MGMVAPQQWIASANAVMNGRHGDVSRYAVRSGREVVHFLGQRPARPMFVVIGQGRDGLRVPYTLTVGRSFLWPTTAVPDSSGTLLSDAELRRAAGQRLSVRLAGLGHIR